MANPIYGFRPEYAWPGVLFQVILQGPFVAGWQKQKEVEYWLQFGTVERKAVFFELESDMLCPDIVNKRYILQCLVPDECFKDKSSCYVSFSIRGVGGKSVVSALPVGRLHHKPNGAFQLYWLIQMEL